MGPLTLRGDFLLLHQDAAVGAPLAVCDLLDGARYVHSVQLGEGAPGGQGEAGEGVGEDHVTET